MLITDALNHKDSHLRSLNDQTLGMLHRFLHYKIRFILSRQDKQQINMVWLLPSGRGGFKAYSGNAKICPRAPDKMRICVFHSNLNVKNSIIFGNVRIMYAKHFPDTQLCSVSKRICFVYILMECGLLPIFP